MVQFVGLKGMGQLSLSTLFQGVSAQLSQSITECQALERVVLCRVATEETVGLQAFDTLTQSLQQLQLLFHRLAVEVDVQNGTIDDHIVRQVTLAVLRERLMGNHRSISHYDGEIELF